jgi:hypothetical protein
MAKTTVQDNYGHPVPEPETNPHVHEFEMELTPFSHMRLYGDEKYSLQNMVLKMVDYPAKIDSTKDQTFSIYVDRAYTEWGAAQRLIKSKDSGDAWFNGVSDNAYQYSSKFRSRVAELYGSIALSGLWEARGDDMKGEEYTKYLDLSIKTRKWAEEQAAKEIEPMPITGALMVRMTNVSSGYPCPVLMGVIQKSRFARYSGDRAPFITYPRTRGMDVYGFPDKYEYEDRF